MFNVGDKVKFSRSAKHLKSYDKDAVGEVLQHWNDGAKVSIFSVSWTRKDGSKFATTCISEDKIQPYCGTEYKPSSEGHEDSGWIEWNGGECPVDGGCTVECKVRLGGHLTNKANRVRWNHIGYPGDIIAYRVLNETKEEPAMTLDKAVKELSEARESVAELEKLIKNMMRDYGIGFRFVDSKPTPITSNAATHEIDRIV